MPTGMQRKVNRNGSSIIEVQHKLDFFELDQNVYVYRTTQTADVISNTGITFPCPIDTIKEGVTNDLKNLSFDKPLIASSLMAIDDSALTELWLYGPRSPRLANQTLFNERPFQMMLDGKLKLQNIIEVDSKNFMFFRPSVDRRGRGRRTIKQFTGQPIPIAMYFGHQHSLTDEKYDLDALVSFLMTQPTVMVTAQKGFVEEPLPRRANSSYDAIYTVPITDMITPIRKCIHVCWIPTEEMYAKVWNQAKVNGDLNMHKAAMELDVLGLHKKGRDVAASPKCW